VAAAWPNWARNRNDVLVGSDGLFTSQSARWYQPLGGAVRNAGNHLSAFQRFIELPIPMIPIARSGVFDRGGSEAA